MPDNHKPNGANGKDRPATPLPQPPPRFNGPVKPTGPAKPIMGPTFGEAIKPFLAAGFPPWALLPILPPDAVFDDSCGVPLENRGKVPGRFLPNGKWVGLRGNWPRDGLSE